MKAMLLAAGLGTRLGKLSETTPKCLNKIANSCMLELVVTRLQIAGITSFVINIFHLKQKIKDYLDSKSNFSAEFKLSEEQELLGTGGGIKQAKKYLDTSDFIVHNTDIYCESDLKKLIDFHNANKNFATLAVKNFPSKSLLLCDDDLNLCGVVNKEFPERSKIIKPGTIEIGLSGIYILSQEIFKFLDDYQAPFSIIDPLLDAVRAGKIIKCFNIDTDVWFDIGTPEQLEIVRNYHNNKLKA